MHKPIDIIGAGFGWGAQRHETEWGPRTIFESGLVPELLKHRRKIQWQEFLPALPYTAAKKLSYHESVKQVESFAQKLSTAVNISYTRDHWPIVIGGDHSIAIGTWSGLIHALNAPREFGLIWIDAHMDSHTVHTTPSQAIHGMPLAVLLGYGEENLVNISMKGAKLAPQHVVLIGVRSYEEGEQALLNKLNVKIYYMKEVKERGFAAVFDEAIKRVKKNTKGFGLSIDLDAFDPLEAPGVGSPVIGGLLQQEVLPALANLDRTHLKGLEITEFNPTLDQDAKTANLIKAIILNLL